MGPRERDADQSHPTNYCTFCGAQNYAEAVFCWSCGERLVQPPTFRPRQPRHETEPFSRPRREPPIAPSAEIADAEPAYASFWQRLGAYLIDYVLSTLLSLIPAFIAAFLAYLAATWDDEFLTEAEEQSALDGATAAFTFVALVVIFAYFWLANSWGGTLGKRALGIRVVDASGAGPIGLWRGLGRIVIWFIGALLLYLGWLWSIWDQKRQAWHDKAADSIVVRKGGMPGPRAPSGAGAAVQRAVGSAGLLVLAAVFGLVGLATLAVGYWISGGIYEVGLWPVGALMRVGLLLALVALGFSVLSMVLGAVGGLFSKYDNGY